MTDKISTKLIDAKYKRDYDERLKAMHMAWRAWRRAIITALGAPGADIPIAAKQTIWVDSRARGRPAR